MQPIQGEIKTAIQGEIKTAMECWHNKQFTVEHGRDVDNDADAYKSKTSHIHVTCFNTILFYVLLYLFLIYVN